MSDWRCVGASVTGSRHRAEGVPCDDALRYFGGSSLILVIADGAGSASRGGEGARLLVDSSIKQSRQVFAEGLPSRTADLRTALYRLLARVRADVEEHVETSGAVTLTDLASTIAVVVADNERLGAIQVGDGAIVVLRRDGRLEQIAAPNQPEFVNQTTFLTSPSWRTSAASHVEDGAGIAAVAMMTDGLVPLATQRPAGTPHRLFFAPLFDFAASNGPDEEKLAAFLESDRVQGATGDDVTILLTHRGST